ncbi:hypothetical protein EWM64_g1806 [Hericium alpestre]|uniref:Uncharacterized protein n=1 Tax=Hericium alpestre TaxID=135208 RepID=A0A4Z0A5B9_9AGAM|nr:hypothetical protein EWM64_g1806 [Hericium alpestre]
MSNPTALRLGLTSLVATTGIIVYSLNPTVNKPLPSNFPNPPLGYAAVAPARSEARPAVNSRFLSEKRQAGEKADSFAYVSEKRKDISKALPKAEKGRVPEFHDTSPASGMHQDL